VVSPSASSTGRAHLVCAGHPRHRRHTHRRCAWPHLVAAAPRGPRHSKHRRRHRPWQCWRKKQW
jgi:hypothetical protein